MINGENMVTKWSRSLASLSILSWNNRSPPLPNFHISPLYFCANICYFVCNTINKSMDGNFVTHNISQFELSDKYSIWQFQVGKYFTKRRRKKPSFCIVVKFNDTRFWIVEMNEVILRIFLGNCKALHSI